MASIYPVIMTLECSRCEYEIRVNTTVDELQIALDQFRNHTHFAPPLESTI